MDLLKLCALIGLVCLESMCSRVQLSIITLSLRAPGAMKFLIYLLLFITIGGSLLSLSFSRTVLIIGRKRFLSYSCVGLSACLLCGSLATSVNQWVLLFILALVLTVQKTLEAGLFTCVLTILSEKDKKKAGVYFTLQLVVFIFASLIERFSLKFKPSSNGLNFQLCLYLFAFTAVSLYLYFNLSIEEEDHETRLPVSWKELMSVKDTNYDIALLMLAFTIFTSIHLANFTYLSVFFINLAVAALCYYGTFYCLEKFFDSVPTKFCMTIGLLLLSFATFLLYTTDVHTFSPNLIFCTFLALATHSGNALVILSVYPDIMQSCNTKLGFLDITSFSDKVCSLMYPSYSIANSLYLLIWIVMFSEIERFKLYLIILGMFAFAYAVVFEIQFRGGREFICKKKLLPGGIRNAENELSRRSAYYALIED